MGIYEARVYCASYCGWRQSSILSIGTLFRYSGASFFAEASEVYIHKLVFALPVEAAPRGSPVNFIEGGRSRTGKLLPLKWVCYPC